MLALSACEEPDGRADTVSHFVPPDWFELSQDAIDETEFIYGLELLESDAASGSIAVFLVAFGTEGWGAGNTCTPWISAPRDNPRFIAHEFGHALGLEHTDEPTNIMNPDTPGQDITDAQTDRIRHQAWVLNNECRK